MQLAVARGAAVAAVAQAAARAAHRDERLERRVEARRRLAHFARARRGAAGAFGATRLASRSLSVSPHDIISARCASFETTCRSFFCLPKATFVPAPALLLAAAAAARADRAARMTADRERAAVGASSRRSVPASPPGRLA